MTLRQKTLLIIGAIFAALVLLLSLLTRTLLLNSYEDLQAQDTRANVQRAVNSLLREMDNFAGSVDDYARWDDTLAFVETLDEDYVADNLTSDTFVTFHVDFMVFIDQNGEIVYSKGVNLGDGSDLGVPTAVLEYITQHPNLSQFTSVDDAVSGFALLPQAAAIIASEPIRTSLNTEPIGGSLIWIRMLDDVYRALLTDVIQLSVDWHVIGEAQLPPDFRSAFDNITPATPTFVHVLDESRSGGYAMLNDIDGNPGIILRVETPRSIAQVGQQSTLLFVVALIILGIAAVIAALGLIERLVLARLAIFSADVRRISQTSVAERVSVSGADELGALEAEVNKMLEQIESAQNELRNAKDAAEQANRAKSTFLANMSHELRTPLNAIMGFLSIMMMNGKLDSKDTYRAQRAYANSERLLNTINDILDISRIEAGRMQVVSAPINVRETIESVRSQVDVLMEDKHLDFNLTVSENVPNVIEIDGDALTKIINNLVSNAIKFTEKGSVNININSSDNQLVIKVSDTGIGIAPHMYDLIFESFRQVDESTTRPFGGVGLGLAIVQNLCKAMHGSVRVESELGQGTTFTVTLPFARVGAEVV